MYNSYHHGQSLPSLPLPQQQHSLYFAAPPHHSLPPPPPKFFMPSQLIHQQQLQQFHRQRQVTNTHLSNHQNSNSWHIPTNARRSLSNTSTLAGSTSNRKSTVSSENTPNSISNSFKRQKNTFSVVHAIKSTADWIAKTFCFCFTDDDIEFKHT